MAHLHADNCGGQNKIATMVHYLLWHMMTGQHDLVLDTGAFQIQPRLLLRPHEEAV